jgi:hypothetical protein
MKFRSFKYALMLAFPVQSGVVFSMQSNVPTEEEVAQEMKVHFAKQDAELAKWKAEKQGDFRILSSRVGDAKMIIYEGDADERSTRNVEAINRLVTVADTACPGLSNQPIATSGLMVGATKTLETEKNLCQLAMSRSVQLVSVNGQIKRSAQNSPLVIVLLLKPKTQIEATDNALQMTALARRKLMLLTPLLDLNGNKWIPGAVATEATNQNITYSSSPLPKSLKAAMDTIPLANRPIGMVLSEGEWNSFTSTFEFTNMVLFPGGVAISADCRNWNPQQSPKNITGCEISSYTVTNGMVRFSGDKDDVARLSSFKGFVAGKSVSINVRNVGGVGIASYDGGISQVSRGELVMTPSGEISSGNWVSSSFQGSGYGVDTNSNKPGVTGKYYLDGFLIAVQDRNGQISIGFIGQKHESSDVYTYLNGEQFWK